MIFPFIFWGITVLVIILSLILPVVFKNRYPQSLKDVVLIFMVSFIFIGIGLGLIPINEDSSSPAITLLTRLGAPMIMFGLTGFVFKIYGLVQILEKHFEDMKEKEIISSFLSFNIGIIVHPDHKTGYSKLLPTRYEAIDKYLKKNDYFRLTTLIGDKYFEDTGNNEIREILIRKIEKEFCRLKILLYFPKNEILLNLKEIPAIKHDVDELIAKQKIMMNHYKELIDNYSGNFLLKFSHYHLMVHGMFLGNRRCYSSFRLDRNLQKLELPCIETFNNVYDEKADTILNKMIEDFDKIFTDDNRVYNFNDVYNYYFNNNRSVLT